MDFINKYCKKYGVECVAAAEHNDEKTKHWQILFLNYDFTKHACIRGKIWLYMVKTCKIWL